MKRTESRGRHPRRPGPGGVRHLAVVAARDAILLVAVGPSGEAVMSQLELYVRSNAPKKLWATDAAQLERLFARGDRAAAIELYFARVGERWDPEFLHQEALVTRPDRPSPRA